MMLPLMLYVIVVASAFSLFGVALEQILARLRRPRRWAWAIALAGSLLVPAAVLVTPQIELPRLSAPSPRAEQSIAPPETAPPQARNFDSVQRLRWPSRPAWDAALGATWIFSAGCVWLWLALSGVGLRRVVRRLPVQIVDGIPVRAASDLGPAVVGAVHPQIVLPAWMGKLPLTLRAPILCHEREHLAAHDPLLRTIALYCIGLAPWNPALWWQFRRLCRASELDCDRRVVASGIDAHTYAEALLAVGQWRSRLPLGTLAIGGVALERRIEIVLAGDHRTSRAWTLVALIAGIATWIAACSAPPPRLDADVVKSPQPSERNYLFSIQSEALTDGLQAYGRQAALNVLFKFDELAGVKGNAVIGTMTASEGISTLLAGTGCEMKWSEVRGLPLALVGCPHVADSAPPANGMYRFSIESGPLSAGLHTYLQQSPVELLYRSDEVTGRQGAAVRGTLSPPVAMALLLAGTGCQAKWSGSPDTSFAMIDCRHRL